MKILCFEKNGKERLGIIYNNRVFDVKGSVDYLIKKGIKKYKSIPQDSINFIKSGKEGLELVRLLLTHFDKKEALNRFLEPIESLRLLSPISKPGKLLCLAGNFRKHLKESRFEVLEDTKGVTPWVFVKPPSNTVIGSGHPIRIPKIAIAIDWEVELGVVIGRCAKCVKEKDAYDYVYGYTIVNDISERKFNSQLLDRKPREWNKFYDWLNGKWFDTFAPIGPVVTTKDEIPDPHKLDIKLQLNNKIMQNSNTSYMIFTVPQIIEFITSFMMLEPGDIIAMGTPEGTGLSSNTFLKDGDILKCEIQDIGILKNAVMNEI